MLVTGCLPLEELLTGIRFDDTKIIPFACPLSRVAGRRSQVQSDPFVVEQFIALALCGMQNK